MRPWSRCLPDPTPKLPGLTPLSLASPPHCRCLRGRGAHPRAPARAHSLIQLAALRPHHKAQTGLGAWDRRCASMLELELVDLRASVPLETLVTQSHSWPGDSPSRLSGRAAARIVGVCGALPLPQVPQGPGPCLGSLPITAESHLPARGARPLTAVAGLGLPDEDECIGRDDGQAVVDELTERSERMYLWAGRVACSMPSRASAPQELGAAATGRAASSLQGPGLHRTRTAPHVTDSAGARGS